MKRVPLIKMLAGSMLVFAVASSPVFAADAPAKKEALYPNATRKEPKLDLTNAKDQKAVNDGLDAVNAQDKDKAEQLLQPIIDGSKSKYAQALALQGLANVHYNDGDLKGAIDLLKRALDNGVLPNDTYFQLEYELVQFYTADEQYQPALDTLTKWRAEGRRETAESYALEGQADYRLQKYPEAIAAIKKAQSLTDKPEPQWNQILMASYSESGQGDQAAQIAAQQVAANPGDEVALDNAIVALTQAQKYPDAISLAEKAHTSTGAFKNEQTYLNFATLYLLRAQESDDTKPDATKAVAVLDEGFANGVVTNTYKNYKLLGDAATMSDQSAKALAAYKKAIPLASDGEVSVSVGRLLLQDDKNAEAKTYIQGGIDKGVKHKGAAYMLLAEVDRRLKDLPGATAAMKQAALDPETEAKAKAWLKNPTVSK